MPADPQPIKHEQLRNRLNLARLHREAEVGDWHPAALEIDLQEILRRLWRHRGVIVGVFVCLVILATVVITQLTPLYTASAQVMINPRKAQTVNLEAALSGLPLDQETIASEIEVIKSKGLAVRAVNKLELYRYQEFNRRLRPDSSWAWLNPLNLLPDDWRKYLRGPQTIVSEEERASLERVGVIDAFHRSLDIERVERSRVISISFTSRDPKIAHQAANAIADLYIVEQLEAKFDATKKATSWLNDRLAELRKQVDISERAVETYRLQSGLTESKGTTLVSQQVSELSTQLVLANAKRTEAEARLRQVEALITQRDGISSAAEVLASPLIQSLRGQEATVLRKVAELSQEYGDKHPRMINMNAELENIRAKITAEVARIVQGLKNEVAVSASRETALQNRIRDLEQRVGNLNRSEIRLRALEREAKANRTLYENFLGRFKELSEQGDIQQADARVVSYADIPITPSFPRTLLLLGLACVGSLVAGVGTAGVIERLDHGFRSMEQIEAQTGIPAISLLPTVPRSSIAPHDYVIQNPHSAYSESLRSLFASLHLSNVDNPPKIVLMASSVPEEGKTSTAVALARLIARTGKKVILIDGDLRRPQVHRLLGIPGQPGLVEVLAGEVKLDAALTRDEEAGVYILPAGAKPSNPVDLFSSQHLKNLVGSLGNAADMVIIDSAPLAAVSDARILARLVDKTVFIVRWASTRREVVQLALRQLQDAGADLAGVVLSRVDVRKHAGYGYGDSGYYYGRSRKYYTEN